MPDKPYEDYIDGGWDRYVEERLQAADSKISVEPGVHEFVASGPAYDETQCNDAIKDGDILIVASEKIVGLLYDVAYPVAITKAVGVFGEFVADYKVDEKYAGQIEAAIAKAKELGFELQERFA